MVIGSVMVLLNMEAEHSTNPFTFAFSLIVGFAGEYLIYGAFSKRDRYV